MKMYYSANWGFGIEGIPQIGVLRSFIAIKNKKDFNIPKCCDSFFLDSGAFSVWTQKISINIKEYIDFIDRNLNRLDIYASLDDIQSYKISLKNYEIMKNAGLNPLPTFHYGEPFWLLEKYFSETNYVALGGIAKIFRGERILWLNQIFMRYSNSEKNKFHGFGIQDEYIMKNYPWYSVDATSWLVLARYGGIYTPFGCLKINTNIKYNNLVRWITPESERKIKEWVQSLGRDYEIAKTHTVKGGLERIRINILYFEEFSKSLNNKKYNKLNHQKTFFGLNV